MEKKDKEKILQAGKIASKVRKWIRPQIKKGTPLLEIAEKIERKIIELEGQPAFPVNLSINEIAAHYTPSHNDNHIAQGLLKVDFGVHVDGWIADNAFTLDLENNKENKKLIKASEKALEKAINLIKENKGKVSTNQIGNAIQKTIEEKNFIPVANLSGHKIEKYELHAGISIPNIESDHGKQLTPGVYAIEPFTTTGNGKVKDGNPSGIYQLISEKNPRSPNARKILNFIKKEYKTLPFCSRWIIKKFSTASLVSLKELEKNGNLHHFGQLIEISGKKVSQAEHTLLIDEEVFIVTTL